MVIKSEHVMQTGQFTTRSTKEKNMSADVAALKRGKGGKFTFTAQFKKLLHDVKRLDGLRLQAESLGKGVDICGTFAPRDLTLDITK